MDEWIEEELPPLIIIQRNRGEIRNRGHIMDPVLEDAAIRGDIALLHQILAHDPLALDRIKVGGLILTPLHIAAFHGHLHFVEEIIRRCSSLAIVLDDRRWSPLHLASSQGHRDVVRVLLQVAPEMCGVIGGDGRNPFHIAAVMSRESVLTELLTKTGTHGARAITNSGENVLHLCIKHDRFECLKLLLERIKDPEFVNAKDSYGNNVFHQAVKNKRIQMINYLITEQIKVNMNATNATGLTPLDLLLQENNLKDIEIRDILRKAGAMKSDEILSKLSNPTSFQIESNNPNPNTKSNGNSIFGSKDWLPKRRDSLMFIASLIAAMAFSAGLTPPGGVWQDHLSKIDHTKFEIPHRAGEAIMAYNYPRTYKFFVRTNTIAYVSSLSIILLLISGLPFRHRRYMWAMQMVMWVTITSMAFTYAYVLSTLTPEKDVASLKRTLMVAVLVWCIVMALVFIGNALRLVLKWFKGKL